MRLHTNERATADALRERLEWLLADAVPGDHRVLHFSGHGARLPSYNALEVVDQRREPARAVHAPAGLRLCGGRAVLRAPGGQHGARGVHVDAAAEAVNRSKLASFQHLVEKRVRPAVRKLGYAQTAEVSGPTDRLKEPFSF